MAPRTRDGFVYIMSNKSHTLSTGIARDLIGRVREHKTGTYPNGFTARYNFDRLVYFEWSPDAARREKQIKAWTRAKRVAVIQSKNPNWNDLSLSLEDLLKVR